MATTTERAAVLFPELFKTWAKGTTYVKDEKVTRRGEVYRALRKHVAKAGWEPEKLEKFELVIGVDEEATNE